MRFKREIVVAFTCLIFSVFCSLKLFAEDGNDLPPDLIKDSLYIVIRPSLSGAVDEGVPLQYPVVTKQTLFGKAITLKINTNDGKLIINFTPYINEDGNFTLVAECQIWTVTDNSINRTWQYFTYFSSIPLKFGDRAMFYPLGLSEDDTRVSIIMEIVCVPSQWITASGKSPEYYLNNADNKTVPVNQSSDKAGN